MASPGATIPGGQIGEYFRLRHLLETRQYGQVSKAKLDQLRDLSQRFHHFALESRFQQFAKDVKTKNVSALLTRALKPTDCTTATTSSRPRRNQDQRPEAEHLFAAGVPLSRTTSAKSMLPCDIGDGIRVDHEDFNLVDNSRITRESSTSSHAIEEHSPCP